MAYTTIDDPSAYFQTALFTGNGGTNAITNTGNSDSQPDMIWFKCRSATEHHGIFDSVRGVTKGIYPNLGIPQDNLADSLASFNSDGFTMGADTGSGGAFNGNTKTMAAWQWKAGTAVSGNSGGSGTAKAYSGSVNTDAGFSIIKYIGNAASGHTIPHHLGVVPKMMIIKNITTDSTNWMIYHVALGNGKAIYFTTAYADVDTGWWNDTSPTSSVFTLGNHANHNANDNGAIAYCFAEKQGYSKFGKWIGNGNNDGPFSYTGFKPAFIMIKRTDVAKNWYINDNLRLGYNVNNPYLSPNITAAETGATEIDILSNGFKIRASGTGHNQSGGTYIYMAIAENPFVTSTGVPATAK